MDVVASRRVDTAALVTHHFSFDDIETAYDLFGHQRDGVLNVAIKPKKKRLPVYPTTPSGTSPGATV